MLFNLFLIIMFIFSGVWVFSSKRKHIMSALLSLEYMVLIFYFLFFLFLSGVMIHFSLIYLTFAACEGALGLSILVVMSRTHGGDYFKSFNFFN